MFEIRLHDEIYQAEPFTLNEYEDLIAEWSDEKVLRLLKKVKGYNINNPKHYTECVFAQLWAISLGDMNQQKTISCECGAEHDLFINYGYINTPIEKGFIYSVGEYKIKFRYPVIFEDKDQIEMVARCMQSIMYKDEEVLISDLDQASLDALYGLLTAEHIELLIKELLSPTISIGLPVECGNVYHIKGLSEMLRVIEHG